MEFVSDKKLNTMCKSELIEEGKRAAGYHRELLLRAKKFGVVIGAGGCVSMNKQDLDIGSEIEKAKNYLGKIKQLTGIILFGRG